MGPIRFNVSVSILLLQNECLHKTQEVICQKAWHFVVLLASFLPHFSLLNRRGIRVCPCEVPQCLCHVLQPPMF